MASFVEVNRAANTTARTALGGAGGQGALPRRTAKKATACEVTRQVHGLAYRLHAGVRIMPQNYIRYRRRIGRRVLGRPWRYLSLACALAAGGCGVRSVAAELYPEVAEHQGRRIRDVNYTGADPFRPDSLQRLVDTQPSRCSFLGLPVCVPFTRIGRQEHRVNVARIHSDVQTLERFYRISGYFNTRVEPTIEPAGEDVEVTFRIARGEAIVLDVLTVTGTEEEMEGSEVAARLPLQPGDIFHLGRFIDASDRVLREAHRRGYAYAQVLRSFSVDTVDSRAEAALDVVLGPIVTVDSIIVRGAPNMGREAVLQQLEVARGDLLRQTSLAESQRNLYQLEIVSLASATVAPDTLQATPEDQSRATVLVSVVEAPLREVEAAVGFGTIECLRTEGRWTHRSFTGGARRLAVRGSVSRLGVGEPFAIGAGRSICPTVAGDTLFGATGFDYLVSADFTQPYLLSPRNQFALRLWTQRQSEPGIFQREAVGSRASLSRRLGARSGGSASIEAERGSTRASPALFCAAFLVCEPETIESLRGARYRSELGVNYFLDRSNAPLDPSAGHVVRTGAAWATSMLGSDVTFFRWTGEGAYYREVTDAWVAALSLRLGNFFRTIRIDDVDHFLPPDERFYAGGAGSVRGFERNALGPGVYVTEEVEETSDGVIPVRTPQFVPTGGTAVTVANAELRMPSPFLSDLLRLVVFVDAGAIGTRALWDLGGEDWRFTPGAGVRMRTPVGPVRMDIGFSPYDRPVAPLLLLETETGRVIRVADEYQASRPGFFGRMRLHLGIGQAF
jgi:outer membrane protein assembly factor BamA